MKFQRLLVLTSILTGLIGCSDNDPATTPEPITPTVTLSGKVADGYIENALVCVDKNANKVCENNEPQALTNASGAFSIPNLTQKSIDNFPLVAEINPTSTDADTGANFSSSFTYTAPAGYTFVSPVTTMVHHLVELGDEKGAAEQTIQNKLSTAVHPNTDYIAIENNESQEASVRDDAKSLHSTAFIWTQLHIAHLDKFKHAQSSHKDKVLVSVDKLTSILRKLKKAGLAHQLKGADFGPENLKLDDDLMRQAVLTTENIGAQIQLIRAKQNKRSPDLLEELGDENLMSVGVDLSDAVPKIYYEINKFDTISQLLTKQKYRLQNGAFNEAPLPTKAPFMMVRGGQIIHPDNNYKLKTVNDNGSLVFKNVEAPHVTKTLTAHEYNLANVPVNAPAMGTITHHELIRKFMPDQTFGPTARGFDLSTAVDSQIGSADGTVTLKCLDPSLNPVCFNYLTYRHDGEIKIGRSDIVSTDLPELTFSSVASGGDLNLLKGPVIATHHGEFIVAELIRPQESDTSGTVNYYKIAFTTNTEGQNVESSDFVTSSTWSNETNFFELMIKLVVPEQVIAFDLSGITANNTYIMAQNGDATIAPEYSNDTLPDSPQIMVNSDALQDMLSNLNTSDDSSAEMKLFPSQKLARCNSYDDIKTLTSAFGIPRPESTSTDTAFLLGTFLCANSVIASDPSAVPGTIDFNGKILTGYSVDGSVTETYTFTSPTEVTYTANKNGASHDEQHTWSTIVNDNFISIVLAHVPSSTSSAPLKRVHIAIFAKEDNLISTKIFFENSSWLAAGEPEVLNGQEGLIASQVYVITSQ
ncbi:hypothetical protein D5R81_16910 [Parashewanella spongiae]|uniref:Uncharacterized protein n=1 Tax=Parashewanella spongiae TaxID=342950 RepID=A0A3A6TPF5_9GAMM|nr:hypothetical protein [Parashewanella spongiae]MCL1079755.1 hypothetical protein [Parashewanella spongiae]RJY06986.1 hypothetical protein D5R81_16910 [Parashewanella spongiae]